MAKLAYEAEMDYLRHAGTHCMRCGGDDIEGVGSWETDGDWATHEVRCNDCGLHWRDGYTLKFVVFGEGDVNPDGTLKEAANE